MTHEARLKPPRLVGLCGFAGAGKDTVGAMLVERYSFARVAFADAVRDLLYALDPSMNRYMLRVSDLVDHGGWDEAKRYTEVRALLQRLGQSARDVLGEDVWIDAAFRKVGEALTADDHLGYTNGIKVLRERYASVVITDVRYPNEATRISDEGGVLVYIHRGERVNDHASEDLAEQMAEWYSDLTVKQEPNPSYHYVIDNTGTLDELSQSVTELFTHRLGLSEGG